MMAYVVVMDYDVSYICFVIYALFARAKDISTALLALCPGILYIYSNIHVQYYPEFLECQYMCKQ